MDLMTALDAVPGIGPALPYIAALIAVFTALAATLPPPKVVTGWYAQMYRVVNFVAMNFGHARNATAPAKLPAADPHAVASPDHSKL